MKRFALFQWAAALTMALTLAPLAASAQEDGTVTISGRFSMDYEFDSYYLDPDLWAAYLNGQDHTWVLTLYGTTASHDINGSIYATEIHADSFNLEFFGPNADALNGYVSDYLAGGDAAVSLRNTYYDNGGGFAMMDVAVWGRANGAYIYSGHDIGVDTLFPADEDGYPVVEPEPFSIEPDYTELGYYDLYSGGAMIGSLAGPVTFAGSVGQPPPPPSLPTLAIQDGSVLEGKRGTTYLNLTVTLSASSTSVVTVNYATDDGTAIAGSDYYSAIGTLTFQPGQTRKTISISVKGDRKREPNETFYVDLFEPDGAVIADGAATATILNDD